MFILEVEADFEAGHCLPGYPGPCSNYHGHSYVIWAMWRRYELNELGIAIDLCELKKLLREVVAARYDHKVLNDVMSGKTTAEVLAMEIWQMLRTQNYGGDLLQVAVQETRGTKVTYIGND